MANLFDGLGGRLVAPIMAKMNADAEAEAVDILDPLPDSRNLVIGFGPGVGIELLGARTRSGSVVGIDPSLAMLKAASMRNKTFISSGNVELMTATADKIPSPDSYFDGAIAVHTLQLCEPIGATVAELARVMKPAALLVTITHSWAVKKHAESVATWQEAMFSAFETGGFVDLATGLAKAEKGSAILFTARRSET
jgi:ubiquinone/menaquinone biosynthesis C-methylase UbiE